jgi:hypothetical protein
MRYTNGTTVIDKLYTWQQQEMEIRPDYYIALFLPGEDAVHFFAQVFVFVYIHVILL